MNHMEQLEQAKSLLFKPELGQAIFDGRKTMTRRVVKTSTERGMKGPVVRGKSGEVSTLGFAAVAGLCPYGNAGDYLYVKETFYAWGRWETRFDAKKGRDAWRFIDMTLESGKAYRFSAPDQLGTRASVTPAWHKRPSLFMPRIATRSLLRIVSVRVERLQDISEADAIAEGAEPVLVPPDGGSCPYYQGFMELWQHINGAESWKANSWVWVITFERVAP